MKRTLFIIIILIFNICLSQNEDKTNHLDFQKEFMIKAEENILKNELGKAYFSYQFALHQDSTSVNGIIALRKSDSLKLILRNKLKLEIIGVWKLKKFANGMILKKTDDNLEFDKILIISNSEISFYEQNKKTQKNEFIKREKIQFNNIPDLWPAYSELIYSDKQIWSFTLIENGKNLKIKNTGKVINEKSREQMLSGNSELFYERIK
ncbi:hypothetical protein EC396_12755 [Lutibacter sp. HS1-25]|uniref:hypothetical protein n=1 Tax=Lutibacter sp. HS1-25 TaxID=2485000 RepID=UPI001013A16F|nr:hypothetical protein [Lutibacter sp. HS1-25]RXP48475.1 hypothetical protein EC396_12755 [Lutibacter sp. HS1-25]